MGKKSRVWDVRCILGREFIFFPPRGTWDSAAGRWTHPAPKWLDAGNYAKWHYTDHFDCPK